MIKKTFFQITDSFRLNIKLFCYTHLTYMSVLEFDCDFCFTSSKYLYCSPILEKHQMPKIHDLKFLVNNAFFQMMRVFYIIIKRLFFCYFKLCCPISGRQGPVHTTFLIKKKKKTCQNFTVVLVKISFLKISVDFQS